MWASKTNMPPLLAGSTTSASIRTEPLRSNLCNSILASFPHCSQTLCLFFTGAAHHSWDILADQEESTRLPSGPAVEALHQVKEAGALMKEALLCGNLEHFGHLLDDAWQAKKRISQRISNPRIDHFYAVAREHGAIGGKITGAGGGGFLLLYSRARIPGCCACGSAGRGFTRDGFCIRHSRCASYCQRPLHRSRRARRHPMDISCPTRRRPRFDLQPAS